jgi:hypothetical protein
MGLIKLLTVFYPFSDFPEIVDVIQQTEFQLSHEFQLVLAWKTSSREISAGTFDLK